MIRIRRECKIRRLDTNYWFDTLIDEPRQYLNRHQDRFGEPKLVRYNQTGQGMKGRAMIDYHNFITLEPGKRSGKPCIRGLRISVQDVLDWLASGMTLDDIVANYPELKSDDVLACLAYAEERR